MPQPKSPVRARIETLLELGPLTFDEILTVVRSLISHTHAYRTNERLKAATRKYHKPSGPRLGPRVIDRDQSIEMGRRAIVRMVLDDARRVKRIARLPDGRFVRVVADEAARARLLNAVDLGIDNGADSSV